MTLYRTSGRACQKVFKDELMDLNGEEKDVFLLALKTAIHDLIDAIA